MLRLLLVEDEENLRLSMRDMIDWKAMGIAEVTLAADALEALALVDACPPQIVLSDINMPGLSGLEMARRVLEKHPEVRFVFFSAYSDISYLQQALRMGSVDYLLKPLCTGELADAIARAAESISRAQKQHGHRQLLEDYGDRLAPPVLGRLLLGQGPVELIREQLLALDLERETRQVAVWMLTGFATPEEALLRSCLRRVSRLSPDRGMLVPLEDAAWAYVELLPSVPPADWQEDIARQLALHLQLAGQLTARVHALPLAEKLTGLYGAAARQMEALGEAQEHQKTRDAQRARQICEDIRQYIEAHYMERELSAGNIAKALHYTSAYICTIFKSRQRMTIHDYMNLYRITQAKGLLANTGKSIAAIAQEVGYENDNYFARVFRKLEQKSPSDYRKEHRA